MSALVASDQPAASVRTVKSKECRRCKAALRTPARHCGMCEAERLEATVRDLAAPKPASTLAVWKLRDAGLTGPQVVAIRREVRRGRSFHEVVTAIRSLANWGAGA
jgi:ribosomal protein L40E